MKDRKGIGGFIEAMLALSIIVVSVTLFMGILAGQSIDDCEEEIDTAFISSLQVVDGRISDDLDISFVTERYCYSAVELDVSISVPSEDSFSFSYGDTENTPQRTLSGTVLLKDDEGRTVLASYRMVLWR